jgi:hypothetical protein
MPIICPAGAGRRRRIDAMQNGHCHERRSRPGMAFARSCVILALSALSLLGCNNANKPNEVVDSNVYPTNYKTQISTFLMTVLTDNADFRNSLISPPALKPVGDNQHFVACVQLNGHNQHKEKAVIYFAGNINQFVDATADECAGVAYEPFKELAPLAPR